MDAVPSTAKSLGTASISASPCVIEVTKRYRPNITVFKISRPLPGTFENRKSSCSRHHRSSTASAIRSISTYCAAANIRAFGPAYTLWIEHDDGKRKMCSEVLIHPRIEPDHIIAIHCFTTSCAKALTGLVGTSVKVTERLFFR